MSRILQNYYSPHNRFLMSKNCFRNFQKHWSINFALFLENLLPLRPFLVARVGNRSWRSKSLRRKKSRRKLCARAPWSDRWVPAKILEMYRCHVNITVRICKDVFQYNFSGLVQCGGGGVGPPNVSFFLAKDI